MLISQNRKILSASLLILLGMMGYSAVGPLISKFAQGSTPAILFRAMILGASVLFLFVFKRRMTASNWRYLAVGIVLVLMYLIRILEDFMVGVVPQVPFANLIGLFIGTGILPGLIMCRYVHEIKDEIFMKAVLVILFIFIVGVVLTINDIVYLNQADQMGTTTRVAFSRVGPIALSSLSFSFIIFFIIFFKQSHFMFLTALLVVPVLIIIIVYTNSRGPLVSFIGALIALVLLSNSHGRIKYIVSVVAFFILVSLVGWWMQIDFIYALTSRFFVEESFSLGRSGDIRLYLWEEAWETFTQNPFFGLNSHSSGGWPIHNSVLEILSALGLVGGFVFAIFLFNVVRSSRLVLFYGRSKTMVFIVSLFFMNFFGSLFSGALYGFTGFWISAFCILSFGYRYRVIVELQKKRRA